MRTSLALLIAVGCAEHAGVERQAAAIVGGDETSEDPAVIALAWGDRVRCSGTVIAPRLVLTAAHCLRADLPAVVLGHDPSAGGARLAVVGQIPHPDFGTLGSTRDVAVLILAEPIAIAPVPLATTAAAVAVGSALRVVGFGHTGPGGQGAQVRRTGTVEVSALTAEVARAIAAPAQVCFGDSGGAALAVGAAAPRLAGVISDVGTGCEGEAVLVRVDALVDDFLAPWLRATADGGAATGDRCWFDAQCAAGPCLPARDQPAVGFCAAACAGDDACPDAMVCDDGACRHPAPSPGAQGGVCALDLDCHQGLCLTVGPGGAPRCSRRCVPGGTTCGADQRCVETAAGGDYGCAPAAGAGCGVADGGSAASLVLIMILGGRLRRRRRAR